MITKHVIGQKIVAVKQATFWNDNTGSRDNDIEYLELENGVRLYPLTIETDGEYAHDFAVNEVDRKTKKRLAKAMD